MYQINRAVAIFKPRQPYLDWASRLPEPMTEVTLDMLRRDCLAVLIPPYDYDDEAESFIKEIYNWVFEQLLFDWHKDAAAWPQPRDYETFRQWFDVETHSVVLDPFEEEIFKEREDDSTEEVH